MVHSPGGSKLAPVTRRTVLGGGLAAPFLPSSPAAHLIRPSDPVLPLWAGWQHAWADAAALGAKWAALETRLVREVGFPRVALPAQDGEPPAWATTHAGIDAALEQGNGKLGPHLHAELARRQALWRDAAMTLGLDEADRRADKAASRSMELAESLIHVPAGSLPGAIAKLELVLRMGQSRADDE